MVATTAKTSNFQSVRSDKTSRNTTSAFTLIELLIVIVLIGGIYALVMPPVDRLFSETKKTVFAPDQIQDYLKKLSYKGNQGTAIKLVCQKDINECEILSNETVLQSNIKINFGTDSTKIRRYLPTPQGGLKEDIGKKTLFELELTADNLLKPYIYEINSALYVFGENSEVGKPLSEKSKCVALYLNNELLPLNKERVLAH